MFSPKTHSNLSAMVVDVDLLLKTNIFNISVGTEESSLKIPFGSD